ncbi:branched-chain amino acid ABC transporter substrate-binding protein [Actinomadura algeriensis]|uniref:Branched-chain amino acid transport system substrate-binding protein n=1 Tax=Actinomadura algeriensis TaxID=1679523 RepID=A0ABR9JQZ2_9ACTN|nr:branched-chain amino acid ABC transporter substrate-binding protein [Actinomadura algeriensis]MBE1532987.1 branched-chain amino acid transport system substrate-binding protein [Actinomadura algeriensis]
MRNHPLTRPPIVRIGAVLLAGTLALTGCGSRGDGGSSGDTVTLKIGFDAPLTGQLSAVGLGMQHSAELAVRKANDDELVPGVKFELVPKDDQATPSIGQQNAGAFVADEDVVGVVGAYNSSVSQSMQPTLATANLLQVSGANTSPALTRGPKDEEDPKRPYKTYFRTVTTDAREAPKLAEHLKETLKIDNVATVSDGKVYGQGVVEKFAKAFEKLGGEVSVKQQIGEHDTDFSAVVSNIANSDAEAVVYGGEYPQAGPLSKQLVAGGADVPVLGCDAIYDAQYIKLAGDAAEGDVSTTAAKPIGESAEQKAFIKAYEAAGHREPYGIFGPYNYDAVMTIVHSVKAVADENGGELPEDGLRAKVSEAAQKVSFAGLTGPIAFDEFGDNTNYAVTLNVVENGKWTVVGE